MTTWMFERIILVTCNGVLLYRYNKEEGSLMIAPTVMLRIGRPTDASVRRPTTRATYLSFPPSVLDF
jgi:hypothetical protein